jgi:UDP-MurNAc hydroxylase
MTEPLVASAPSNNPRIEFVNHASVLLSDAQSGLLSDPWFFGEVFHQGWSLLTETPAHEICRVLDKTTHIWISHEHPDHFSPAFFKQYRDQILLQGITILFQKTRDGRLASFLRGLDLAVIELSDGQVFALNPNFSIRIVRCDLYDSALLAQVADKRVFNLNDCPLHNGETLKRFVEKYGQCDVLLTQFSYAAWKGGKEHIEWRQKAARHKLATIEAQINAFAPSACILFASFVRFSNRLNSYMNDAVNHPDHVVAELAHIPGKTIFFAPGEIQLLGALAQDQGSLDFWRQQFASIGERVLSDYPEGENIDSLKSLFADYQKKICHSNSRFLLTSARRWLPIHPFGQSTVKLIDLDITLRIDLLGKIETVALVSADIALHSSSLAYIFRHEFGFDTLFVNGCFEEVSPGGFERFAKCFAIGNLNASGVYIRWSALSRWDVISLMLKKLETIRKNLRHKKPESSA